MDLLHLHNHKGDSISEKVWVMTASPHGGSVDCFGQVRDLSAAAYRVPIQWLFKTIHTQTAYPSASDNKSSSSI